MQKITAIALIAACIAGAALAQEGPLVFTPTWDVEPTPQQNVTHYPRQALAQNVSGIAVVCCRPRADRSLDCGISSEWPAGHGFGAATQRAASAYRLSPQSALDLEQRPNVRIRLSMMWAGAVITDDTRNTLFAMDRDTAEACLAPPT